MLAPLDGRLVRAAPGLEELHQLLAGAVVVPFAVALDDCKQLLGGRRPVTLRVERGGEVEARLMIERICGDFLFQLGDGPERLRLLGEVDRGLHGLHRRVVTLGFRHHGQCLLGLLDRTGGDVAFGEAGKRRDVGCIRRRSTSA